MSYKLLEELRKCHLPVIVYGDDANTVKSYVAAGLVIAEIPDQQPALKILPVARILGFTPLGRKTIEAKKVQDSLAAFKNRK